MINDVRKFDVGQILSTPAAIETIRAAGRRPSHFLRRHMKCDWGILCDEDKSLNDQALVDGSRLLSAYETAVGDKIWIITEAEDEQGNRVATTILLPTEY